MEAMSFLHKFLMIAPAACLLAQTPPATAPAPAPAPATATPGAAPATPKLATPIPPGLLPPALAKPAEVPPDRVVLRAGSVTLTKKQFDDLIDGLPENAKAMARGPRRKEFADFLVQAYILSDEARRRKLDETHAYRVQSMLSDDQVLSVLLRAQITDETKVDEAEARKYYDEHKGKYEEVTARHILIRVKGSPTAVKPGAKELTDQEALAKATEVRKRILAGEDFAAVAKTESDDSTASSGGALGSFPRGRMVPTFEQAAFALKPGEISEPVKTQFGYHIIKVEDHKTKTFEEVREQIEKQLVPQQVTKTIVDMTKGAYYDPEFFAAPTPPPQMMRPGLQPPPGAKPIPPNPPQPNQPNPQSNPAQK